MPTKEKRWYGRGYSYKRNTEIRLRQVVPNSKRINFEDCVHSLIDETLEYRKWKKSLRDQTGSIQMLFGIIMSVATLMMVSLIWIVLNNPVATIIEQSMAVVNTSVTNSTLTTTRLQWDYIPWFAIILFLVMIFMYAYWYSRHDRPEEVGYYQR